jgi:hypothetical protein
MKKVALSLIGLLAAGSFAFGQDAPKPYTVTADASVVWAYDVESETHGFANEENFRLEFPIAVGATEGVGGEGTYGEIKVTGVNLAVQAKRDAGTDTQGVINNNDDDGIIDSFTATIHLDKIYFEISSAPGFGLNNAHPLGTVFQDAYADDNGADPYADSIQPDTSFTNALGGFTAGYADDLYTFEALIASNGDGNADATDDNTQNEYVMGVNVSAKIIPDVLTVGFKGFMDGGDAALTNKGATATVNYKPLPSVSTDYAFDYGQTGDADAVWELAIATTYSLENSSSLTAKGFYSPAESYALGGIGSATAAYTELSLSFTEDGPAGFLPLIGASAYVKGYDLQDSTEDGGASTDGLPVFVGGSLDYSYGVEEGKTIRPYAGFDYGLLHAQGVDNDNGLAFKVGVEAKIITNTTLTAEFVGGAVNNDSTFLTSITPYGEDGGKGKFTVTAKIAF